MKNSLEETYFSTITVNNWISVFEDFPKTKEIIIDTLHFIHEKMWAKIYAFVIMRDHIHIVWKLLKLKSTIEDVTNSFKKFTGKRIVNALYKEDLEYLKFNFISQRHDRTFKFWKVDSNNFKLLHIDILWQKINYTHNNPTKGYYKTVDSAEDYIYSSALSYKNRIKRFEFLTFP